jgi:hypothetical protein
MSYEEDGERIGTSFMIPRSQADLVRRRESMTSWANATFGMVGRSPDFLNTTLMTWAESADFFAQRGERFADNVRNYYRYCRSRDLFSTHAIVNPQTDRSRGSHQHEDAFAHLGVLEETKDGLIVRGAKMLATTARPPTSCWSSAAWHPRGRGALRPGLQYPCATPGCVICREPFDSANQSEWTIRSARGSRSPMPFVSQRR